MGQQATHTLGLRSLVKFARENVPLFARILARGLQTPRIWMSKHPTRSHRARKVIPTHRDVPRETRARIFSHAILRATHTEGKKRHRARATTKPNHATTASARPRARCVENSFVRAKRRLKKRSEQRGERTHHDEFRECAFKGALRFVLYKLRRRFRRKGKKHTKKCAKIVDAFRH